MVEIWVFAFGVGGVTAMVVPGVMTTASGHEGPFADPPPSLPLPVDPESDTLVAASLDPSVDPPVAASTPPSSSDSLSEPWNGAHAATTAIALARIHVATGDNGRISRCYRMERGTANV
jgi:hypothetical protein